MVEATKAIKIFYSYAYEDKTKRDELEKHLVALKRSGKILTWYDRDIQAGLQWEQEIETRLNSADLILLLVSHHFMNSDYCCIQMERALERQASGEARVIPIILSPCDTKDTLISGLQSLPALPASGKPIPHQASPASGKPITEWRDRHVAFVNVVQGIRVVVETLLAQQEEAYRTIVEQKQQTIDTHEAFKLFHQLMATDSHFRVLYLIGNAKMGKSHLLTKVFPVIAQHTYQARSIVIDLRNRTYTVPDILNIVCEQLGPKICHNYDTACLQLTKRPNSNITRFLSDFSYVDASMEAYSGIQKRDERLTTQLMLDLSKLQDKPLVFFFDSVNNASEQVQAWLTSTFLPRVSLFSHIRTVVAGRTIPAAPGSYVDLHQLHQLSPVEDEAEYIAYCQSIQVNLADQLVRSIARDCNYTPGMFVDFLFTRSLQKKDEDSGFDTRSMARN